MRELALNVMDVAQNSISAKADLIRLTVEEDTAADRLTIRLEDNGCGMTPEQVKSVVDPFYTTRTTRKVGLGVPLFKMEAEMTGGSFSVWSQKGEGTALTAVFVRSFNCEGPPRTATGALQLILHGSVYHTAFSKSRTFCSIHQKKNFRIDNFLTRYTRAKTGENCPVRIKFRLCFTFSCDCLFFFENSLQNPLQILRETEENAGNEL